jgi:hypothetical protein
MHDLADLIWLTLAGVAVLYLLRSGQFKGRARQLAIAHCQQLGLQLLDQSMVIVGLWPVRRSNGLVLRRSYQFEFASTGDRRYQGKLVLEGMRLVSIELETYKLPEQD